MRMTNTAPLIQAPNWWALEHPLWMCAMRPFFVLTMGSAVLLVALWSAVLALGLPPPRVAGGALVWHAHELLLGFGLAAVAGFVLTAVPEFTATASASPRTGRLLVLLWLLGRLGVWLSGAAGLPALALAALAHLGLIGGLLILLLPALRTVAGRRQHAFGWALAALFLLAAGFYVDALRGQYPMRWLLAVLGLVMVLIIVAMSRISMRIVNRSIDEAGEGGAPYLARPPKRNLAILCIVLFTLAEFWHPGGRVSGWLACAAAAALCNLMGDWHVGRPLLRRWPFMLYAVYVCMALGYALIGTALLAGGPGASAGRHLLTMGALGLSIYVVISIAGRAHCGHPSDERPWVVQGALLIGAGAMLRAGTAFAPEAATALLGMAGMCWVGSFGLMALRMLPVLWGPRPDGGRGCEG